MGHTIFIIIIIMFIHAHGIQLQQKEPRNWFLDIYSKKSQKTGFCTYFLRVFISYHFSQYNRNMKIYVWILPYIQNRTLDLVESINKSTHTLKRTPKINHLREFVFRKITFSKIGHPKQLVNLWWCLWYYYYFEYFHNVTFSNKLFIIS